MEEEPEKADNNQTFSEDDKSSKVKDKEKSSSKRPTRRFRDFLAGGTLEESESSSPKSSSGSDVSSKVSKEKAKGEGGVEKGTSSSGESQELHFGQELMRFDFYRKLRSNKDKVIKITGGLIGAIFIISGILYLFGAAVRVADNVVFGERAVWSAFLVLVGVLILAGVFASSLLEGSFLKHIHNELEVAEDSSSNGRSSDKKKKQKSNIDEKDKK